MDTRIILNYLSELNANNNREWYHAHRDEYKEASSLFEGLLEPLILEIGKFDGSVLCSEPGKLTFKLVRDTRFSRDKAPYNPAFRAHISSRGKLPIPVGYYLMISPGGNSFLGGGLFADMFKDATDMVREYISAHPAQWDEIINAPDFQKYFTVQGTGLKNVPKGYEREHPQAEFLKLKNWYLEYPIKDEELLDASGFISLAARVFEKMKPFNDYLNTALEGFEMPKR